MTQFVLPPDDLPPAQLEAGDHRLLWQLQQTVNKLFYQACDGVTQGLLINCEWSLTISAPALTLVITCTDMDMSWRVLRNIDGIRPHLERFSPNARIRVCPPEGDPIELHIDEISVYQDLL